MNAAKAAEANGGSTSPDDIPPVHVLLAAQNQERKETEDLLSGFDRPGRTPRRHNSGDFVEHYGSNKPRNSVPKGPMPSENVSAFDPSVLVAAAGKAAHENKTVLVPRKRNVRALLMWGAISAAIIGLTALLAIVATSEGPSSTGSSGKSQPSVALSPMTPLSASPTATTTNVPSPTTTSDPTTTAAPTLITAPPPSSARDRDRRATSPSANASPTPAPDNTATTAPGPATSGSAKPPPRDDLIRNF